MGCNGVVSAGGGCRACEGLWDVLGGEVGVDGVEGGEIVV